MTEFAVFDLETTGTDVARDRIVTAFVGVMDGRGQIRAGRSWLVDPGVAIPARATAVHGITTEHAREHGQDARAAVYEIGHAIAGFLDIGMPVCAFNASYDLSLLLHESIRHQTTAGSAEHPRPILDPLVIDRAFDRWRSGPRRLTDVARVYGASAEGDPHGAEHDAVLAGRTMLALQHQAIAAGRVSPEVTAEDWHRWSVVWNRDQQILIQDRARAEGRVVVTRDWPIDAQAS